MTYRILVVDDELPALEEMEDLLRDEPLAGEIYFQSLAQQALEWALEHEPDIVFVDIQMPGMNGLAFAEYLLDAKPFIEVVFVTAYHQYALQAFELSAVDYVLKPVKPERLRRTLQRIHRHRHYRPAYSGGETAAAELQENAEPMESSKAEAEEQSVMSNQPPSIAARIYSLGRLQVESVQGHVLKWSTMKVEELFAYLLYKGSVSLDQIIEDVFPNSDLVKARTYVHTCVYKIRRALTDNHLQEHIHVSYSERMYKLVLIDVWHDREQFMNDAHEDAMSSIEYLAALYRGEWCTGLDGMWISIHREELEERYVWLLEDLVNRLQEQGQNRKALSYARKLLLIDGWNEEYASQVAALYMQNGEKTKARQFIQEYREKYAKELGEALPPSWCSNLQHA